MRTHCAPFPVTRLQVILFALVGGLVAPVLVAAAPAAGRPVVQRVDPADAPIDGAVWALAQSRDGTQWVGSNLLAAGDGQRWETIDVPGAYAFRGLAASPDGRVWVGARGNLGYVERDAAGAWHYRSLLPQLSQSGVSDPGDIWHAQALGRGAAFVTTDRVLRWDGDKFEMWRLPAEPHLQAFPAVDSLLIYQTGVGLLRLRASGAPMLEIAERDLPEHPVTWYGAQPDGNALLGLGDGAYRWARRDPGDGGSRPLNAQKFTPLPALSAALRGTLPACAVRAGHELLAIGTFKHGIVFANAAGEVIGAAGSQTGLGEDSVYALAADDRGRIWAGLGNGYAIIEPPDRATIFDARAGLTQGTPLKVFRTGAATAQVLTSKALYAVAPAGLEPLIDAQALLWDATVIDGHTWIGGFGGLWTLDGARSAHEHHVSADVLRLTLSARFPDAVVFLENYELMALQRGPYGWVPRRLEARVGDTPLSLLEDSRGELWVSTLVGGIYRFAWEQPEGSSYPTLHPVAHYREGLGLPRHASRPHLTQLGGRLYAFTTDEILLLNETRTAFESAPGFEGFTGLAAAPIAADPRGAAFWLVRSHLLGTFAPAAVLRVEAADGVTAPRWSAVETPGLERTGQVTGFDFVSSTAGNALWIGGNRGLLRVAEAGLESARPAPALALRQVQANAAPLLLTAAASALPAGTRQLGFRLAASDATGEAVFYQTRLDGVEANWSTPNRTAAREFTGLAPGQYVFTARALDRFGRTGPPVAYAFAIAAPWYRQPAALAGFAALAALGLTGLIRWRMRRLRRQNERLNQLVADRTRELELAGTAKSEFLENISHELRNPLNGLTGLLELLREEELKPRELELTRSLRSCAENLTRVFEEVVNFAKLEYGCVTVQQEPFRLRRLLQDLADLFAIQAARRGNTIQVALPDDFADGFEGDEPKIKTILGNFVGNALKYAPGAPIELKAEMLPTAAGMVDLYVEVTDHGPGVPVNEQELIFQKFVRGSIAHQTGETGAGLGLATCRALARALNGSVGLESAPGQGATFYLRVLVARADATGEAKRPDDDHAASRPATTPPEPAGAPVLIVEDEPYNQTVMKGIALALGYRPETAASGEEAFALIARMDFRVIFLDWELPDLKGDEVARRCRARPGGAAPLIIAATAHDSDEMRRRCLESGMDGFLLKPYNQERVRTLVTDLQARRRARSGAAPATIPPTTAPGLNLEAFVLYAQAAPAHAAEAVPLFVAAVDRELVLLEQAGAARDAGGAARAAHRTRALGGLIGAGPVGKLAGDAESLAGQGRFDELRPTLRALAAEWQRVRDQLGAAPPFTAPRG